MKSQDLERWTNILQRPVRTYTEAELPLFARECFEATREGDRIFLEGDLGAGKSAFSREYLALFSKETFKGSPTFPLNLTYRGSLISPLSPRIKETTLYHMDWYRIKSEAELEERGLIENLWDPECVCLLEWGSQFEETRTEISHAFFSIEILITPTEDMSARVYSIRAL